MSRAISILISALGGEGGGVLASWLSNAAVSARLPVQRTSIPGVAQRTGATTYYLEIFPQPWEALDGQEPVLGLHPTEGAVDVIVATELLEASRAIHRGFATKDRTLLIASTHRVYTIGEKANAAQGVFNERTAFEAVAAATRAAVQTDFQAVARKAGSHMNAVLLGAICGSNRLPIPEENFRDAMRQEGKSVAENLRGFDAGLAEARSTRTLHQQPVTKMPATRDSNIDWILQAQGTFCAAAWPIIAEGISRLVDYQGADYARHYLQRLLPIKELDAGSFDLLQVTARHLALWMSYEDVIRVAQLKSRPARLKRIREAQGAAAGQPAIVVDYLKPGIAEFCSLLPPWLGGRLIHWVRKRGLEEKLAFPMQVHTSSILGFTQMRSLALLRSWRPHSHGFREEQQQIDSWLERVIAAARRDTAFATEVAHCAKLVRGYADTRKRGYERLHRIYHATIDPLLANEIGRDPADAVRRARLAAATE